VPLRPGDEVLVADLTGSGAALYGVIKQAGTRAGLPVCPYVIPVAALAGTSPGVELRTEIRRARAVVVLTTDLEMPEILMPSLKEVALRDSPVIQLLFSASDAVNHGHFGQVRSFADAAGLEHVLGKLLAELLT